MTRSLSLPICELPSAVPTPGSSRATRYLRRERRGLRNRTPSPVPFPSMNLHAAFDPYIRLEPSAAGCVAEAAARHRVMRGCTKVTAIGPTAWTSANAAGRSWEVRAAQAALKILKTLASFCLRLPRRPKSSRLSSTLRSAQSR